TARPHALVSLSANAGVVVRKTSVFRNTTIPDGAIEISEGSGVVFGIGVAVRPEARLRFTAEVFGERVSSNGISGRGMPIEALLGARYELDRWTLGAGVGRGLSDSLGTPDLRGVVTLEYAGRARVKAVPIATEIARATPPPVTGPDSDGDGIPDAIDKC